MPDTRLLIFGIFGLGFGIILFLSSFKTFKRKRLIEDIPTSKIRSIAMGLVEICGEVIPASNRIFKAPFTNKDCVYYRCIVQEERSSGKRRTWVTIKEEEKRDYFYLKDDTGLVLIDPRNAEIDIPTDFQFQSGINKDPPDSLKQYLSANKISYEGIFSINKKMRFYEYHIAPNDKLYIMGFAGDNPFVKEGWAQQGIEDVMIQKGESEIYYISDRSEKEIIGRLKLKMVGELVGGFLLVISCLYALLLCFNLL